MQQLSDLDFNNSSRIVNLPDATLPQHPVTLAQMRAQIEGLAWKDSVRAATTGNINLAAPGSTIDGITLATNDRVLVRAQTAGAENGIYIWNGAATPATRSLDASTWDELESAVVTVEEGTTNAGTTWRQSVINGTLGTTTVTWGAFGTSAAAASETVAGILEIATQAETDAGTDDARAVTPAKLKNSPYSRKPFDATFGDGTATSYTITHNLNSRDVLVDVYRNSGSYDAVGVDVERTTVNSVTIKTVAPVASNALRAVIRL